MLLEMFDDELEGGDAVTGEYSFSGESREISGLLPSSSISNMTRENGEVTSESAYLYVKKSDNEDVRIDGIVDIDSSKWRIVAIASVKRVILKLHLARGSACDVYLKERV